MEKIDILPAQRLKRLIERSPELAAIIELSGAVGTGGHAMALRLIEKRFRIDGAALISQEPKNSGSQERSAGGS